MAQTIPVLVGATFLIFAVVWALPGDPIKALAGPQRIIPESTERVLRERYHLDQPLLTQYGLYVSGLFQGDLGEDFYGREISAIVSRAWPTTFLLATTTWLIEIVIGIPLGLWAGLRQGRLPDLATLIATTLIFGVPVFVAGYMAQIVFAVELGWFPVAGTSDGWPVSFLLPAIVLGLLGLATTARLVRGSVIANMNAPYVDTARAKGLRQGRIVRGHVLRNSLIPVVTYLGIDFGYLLGGTVIIEGIFNLPGLGNEIFRAIGQQNGPTVVGISTLLVVVFILVNLTVDLLYGLLDPRVRHGQ